jgi:hypothetical protein
MYTTVLQMVHDQVGRVVAVIPHQAPVEHRDCRDLAKLLRNPNVPAVTTSCSRPMRPFKALGLQKKLTTGLGYGGKLLIGSEPPRSEPQQRSDRPR